MHTEYSEPNPILFLSHTTGVAAPKTLPNLLFKVSTSCCARFNNTRFSTTGCVGNGDLTLHADVNQEAYLHLYKCWS